MNIEMLEKELQKDNYESEVKNKNEIYIEIDHKNAKHTVNNMLVLYKLIFVAEFCMELPGCKGIEVSTEKAFIQEEGKLITEESDDESVYKISIILSSRKYGYFVIIYYYTESTIESMQDIIFQSHIFEREIADLYGLRILNGSDTRNIVKHEEWENQVYPLRKSFPYGEKIKASRNTEDYRFKPLSGEGGYQIPVGPVHAGIIEPGHFRFSVIGEQIENLEIRLMYKHRGIEKICENVDANKLNLVFERVAGESSVAYGELYALLIEKLLDYKVTEEVKALRVVLLELERMYNFLDDIAGVCVDVGYSYPAKKFSYFSEQIHQLCERLTGSRYLRNTIVPFGINMDFNKDKGKDILDTLGSIKKRMNDIIEMTFNAVSFLDRVEHTGLVYNEKAKRLCLTGVVGRASGISYDVRHSFPYEIYKDLKKEVKIEIKGGVFERYQLKISEIRDAFVFIEKGLGSINKDILKHRLNIDLKEGMEAIATVETVKGELVVYALVGKDNKFHRVYFKTPSFVNWNGLTYAVLNEIVPDFPLCNKSFNMSYSENDR